MRPSSSIRGSVGSIRIDAAQATCREARASLDAFGSGRGRPMGARTAARRADSSRAKRGDQRVLRAVADPGRCDRTVARGRARRAGRAGAATSSTGRRRVRSRATRAYHLRRAAYLEMKGDHEGAARERRAGRSAGTSRRARFLPDRTRTGHEGRLQGGDHQSRGRRRRSSLTISGLSACSRSVISS